MRSPVPPAERLLTVGEAARQLRVNPRTVLRWADAGKLGRVTRTPTGHRRLREVAVLAAKARRESAP